MRFVLMFGSVLLFVTACQNGSGPIATPQQPNPTQAALAAPAFCIPMKNSDFQPVVSPVRSIVEHSSSGSSLIVTLDVDYSNLSPEFNYILAATAYVSGTTIFTTATVKPTRNPVGGAIGVDVILPNLPFQEYTLIDSYNFEFKAKLMHRSQG